MLDREFKRRLIRHLETAVRHYETAIAIATNVDNVNALETLSVAMLARDDAAAMIALLKGDHA